MPTPCHVLEDQALQLDDARARLRSCQADLEARTGELNERGDSLTRCEDRAHRLTLEVGELRRPEPARVPWQLRVGLDVALAGGGIATGAAVGSGAPVEWVVGFAVLEGGLLIARLVVEWLDRTPSRPGRS